jgi:guanylate cyclase
MGSLDALLRRVKGNRDLSISDYFFLFQMGKIKVTRQTSSGASTHALARLFQIHAETRELANAMRQFWLDNDVLIPQIRWISERRRVLEARWGEIIDEYPNSSSVHNNYAEFLLECCCDFSLAARAKCRVERIEDNTYRSVDQCFTSFVRVFPQYLRFGILSPHGNFRSGRGAEGHESFQREGSSVATSSANFSFEDYLPQSVMKHARMRLALENTLRGVNAQTRVWVVRFCVLGCVVTFGLLTGLFAGLYNLFSSSIGRAEFSRALSQCRSSSASAILHLLLHYANVTGRMDHKDDPSGECYLITEHENFLMRAARELKTSQDAFDVFKTELSAMTLTSANSEALTKDMTERATVVPICRTNGSLIGNTTVEVGTSFAMQSDAVSTLLALQDFDNMIDTKAWCTALNAMDQTAAGAAKSRLVVFQEYTSQFQSYKSQFGYMVVIVPILYVLICFAPLPIFTFRYARELRMFMQMMLKTEENAKAEATRPLSPDIDSELSAVPIRRSTIATFLVVFNVADLVLCLGIAGCLIVCLQTCRSTSTEISSVEYWIFWTGRRLPVCYEVCVHVYCCQYLGSLDPTVALERATIVNLFAAIDEASEEIATDSESSARIIGYDDILDSLIYGDDCQIVENSENVHDLYNCSFTVQALNLFRTFANDILMHLNETSGNFTGTAMWNLYHIIDVHFLKHTETLEARLSELLTIANDGWQRTVTIAYVCGIVILLVQCLVLWEFVNALDGMYSSIVMLLKRLPPAAVVANADLLNYLIVRHTRSQKSEMSATQAVIHFASSGILSVTFDRIIEFVNQSVSAILGYSPEQLLGQAISGIIAPSHQMRFEQMCKAVVDKTTGQRSFKIEVLCLTDRGQELPCDFFVFVLQREKNDKERLIVSLENVSKLSQARIAAESAREQNEKLLCAILPRQIVERLDAGEREVSFSVPKATVMKFNLVRFSELQTRSTPQQILATLTTIFGAIEGLRAKFPSVTKVQIVGDSYTAISGLFVEREGRMSEEIIDFALNCLGVLDDLNIKHGLTMTARIGMATGGPVFAGVIGNDKLSFDIIGKPVEMAALLEKWSLPGVIQLSAETAADVSGSGYPLVQRKFVQKGKGEMITYLLRSGSTSTILEKPL